MALSHPAGFARHCGMGETTDRDTTTGDDWLVDGFERHRPHLRAVAYRMLGSTTEADDAVQDTWLRLTRSDTTAVENLGGWLTTIVSRVCLDRLRSRTARREEPWDALAPEPVAARDDERDPEHQALLANSVGSALVVILDTLTPSERLAFVLHDLFAVPFDEIAPIVGRSPAATRQLASRARRRVQGARTDGVRDAGRHRAIVDAFLAASRGGDLDRLLALLDSDVVLRADDATVQAGAEREVRGAAAVAATFSGRARVARPALIDGAPGAVWSQGGRPRVVFDFTFDGDMIVAIDLLADPATLEALDLAFER